MKKFTDQTGKIVSLQRVPSRIISLVPSQTELLYDLGLDKQVVGITKFCVHPENWFRNKTRVGGTKALKTELIRRLQPDFIIANKEENVREQVEELENFSPVWTSDIRTTSEAYDMILTIGAITETFERAKLIQEKIKTSFEQMQTQNQKLLAESCGKTRNLKTAYAIWRYPLMVAGGDTFIQAMMNVCSFRNIFEKKKRYPEITIDDLRTSECELLLLSSEPFPFKEKHATEFQLRLPDTKIILVDGEMFSWYGSRMQYAAVYFGQLLRDVLHKTRYSEGI